MALFIVLRKPWNLRKSVRFRFYISCSGIVTFKNAEAIREVIRYVPMDRLLVETDSPYLAPVPYRGKENQPAYTREVCEYVATLKAFLPRRLLKSLHKISSVYLKFV